MIKSRLLGTVCVCLCFTVNVNAATVFFVESNSYNTVDTTRDQAFQSAVGNQFFELDLDELVNATFVDTLSANGITIDVGLGNPSDGFAQVFTGNYPAGGGTYGTVFNSALLNASDSGTTSEQMTFQFSTPVSGFGAWIFDDLGPNSPETGFTMTVTETGGASTTSSLLSGNNAGSFFVEGFLAATSDVGIESVIITTTNSNDFFEVDHLQVASFNPVPLPAAAWLFGSGLLGLIGMARRSKAV